MAGDWIKMRGNLWDDPRVARLCDATDQSEATVIGALYWLWAAADQHTTDGLMPGLSLRQIDRKTGVPGIGQALADVGWIELIDDGVIICRFDEHNGSSAKKRATTARRVADHKKRKGNAGSVSERQNETAKDGMGRQNGNAHSVTESVTKRYLEKEKDISPPQCARDSGFADGDAGYYAPDEHFRMHDGFQPDMGRLSASLVSAGVPIEFCDRGAVVEFITFWKTRVNQETQAGWESKLVSRLIGQHRRQRNGSQASGSGGGNAGGLSLSERVGLANQ